MSSRTIEALTTFEEGGLRGPPEKVEVRLRNAARAVDRVPVVGARGSTILPEEVRR